jgi:hypothetical protein
MHCVYNIYKNCKIKEKIIIILELYQEQKLKMKTITYF